MTFGEVVAFYGLARSEGLVLRYLSDAYKALRQTVPDSAKTEELADLIEWLGEVVRQTDSSLLDEWEQLTDPGRRRRRAGPPGRRPPASRARSPATPGPSGCSCATRCSAGSSWPPGGAGSTWPSWTPRRRPGPGRLAGGDRGRTSTSTTTWAPARTPAARRCCRSRSRPAQWRVRQVIDDPAGDHDWGITAEVDLAASDEAGEAVVRTTGFEPL